MPEYAIKRTEPCHPDQPDTCPIPPRGHRSTPSCVGCNGDGTRTTYEDAPEGSVLITAEQARWVVGLIELHCDTSKVVTSPGLAALDALGVER
jgi:hypothetical protein